MAVQHQKSTKTVGAGRLFFVETDATGNPVAGAGERYIGDSPGFTLNIETESLEDWSSDGPIAEKDIDVGIRVNRTANITTKNVSMDNLAMFVIGSVVKREQAAATAVTQQIVGVQPGLYYQLGANDANPTGARNVTNVSVGSYEEGGDYEVDAATGRIRIVPGGAIAADDTITVTYSKPAVEWDQVQTDSLGAKYGRLRYVEDATFGPNRDLYAPFVQMKPTGDLAWKSRDTVQQMGFSVSIQSPPAGGAALYIDGRPE